MHALFTEHASKHYHYLRDTMPHLVPRLRPTLTSSGGGGGSEINKMQDMEDNEETRGERGRQFLAKIVAGIEKARPGGRVHTQLLEAAAIDLDRLAEMDHHMEGAARFTALYIRCLLLFKSILKQFSMSSTTCISANPATSNTTSNNISTLLQHAQK